MPGVDAARVVGTESERGQRAGTVRLHEDVGLPRSEIGEASRVAAIAKVEERRSLPDRGVGQQRVDLGEIRATRRAARRRRARRACGSRSARRSTRVRSRTRTPASGRGARAERRRTGGSRASRQRRRAAGASRTARPCSCASHSARVRATVAHAPAAASASSSSNACHVRIARATSPRFGGSHPSTRSVRSRWCAKFVWSWIQAVVGGAVEAADRVPDVARRRAVDCSRRSLRNASTRRRIDRRDRAGVRRHGVRARPRPRRAWPRRSPRPRRSPIAKRRRQHRIAAVDRDRRRARPRSPPSAAPALARARPGVSRSRVTRPRPSGPRVVGLAGGGCARSTSTTCSARGTL